MKKIILFILLIFSVNTQSQVRLGYTLKGIQNEFKQYVQEFNNSTLKIYDNDVIISYYFKNNHCNKVIISTKSIIICNQIMNQYDLYYKKIGNNKWIMNSNYSNSAYIILKYSQNYYNFIWTK